MHQTAENRYFIEQKLEEWEIQTFVRSSSTADERYQHDRKTDKIIENTDFEIILKMLVSLNKEIVFVQKI